MRIAVAQLDPIVGDVAGNTERLLAAIARARKGGADLVVGAELGLLGYPPRDLILREGVVAACERAVARVARAADGITVVVGHPRRDASGVRGVRNSASVCRDGAVLGVYDKRLLPGYDVFDEDRYFDPGAGTLEVDVPGGRLGILICEDLWRAGDVTAHARYAAEPLRELAERGCDLVVNLNASPFVIGKFMRHVEQLRAGAEAHRLPIVAVNQVGGHDDLVFDGRSVVVDARGTVVLAAPGWVEAVEAVDLEAAPPPIGVGADECAEVFHALVLGVRDYCGKTGHDEVLLGLSGGIDSALTAAIAAAALGPGKVRGVIMPSRHSSRGSIEDAEALRARLGLPACERIEIEPAHRVLRELLLGVDAHGAQGLTDENLQARLRAILLMARSNTSGALLLATSNKSELAMGYSTLYGDMCGALAVLGDLVKTRVYALAEWINAHPDAGGFRGPPIPERSITKPPSAELRPNQTDQDTLPPYDVLDAIVALHVEAEAAPERIVAETGLPADLVRDVVRAIDRAEYKRFQSPIILKVTPRAFGRGRPMPLVMRAIAPVPSAGDAARDRPHAVRKA